MSAPQPHKAGQGYWFAQKRFGYGAVPVTWQGWLSTLIYLALVGLFAWRMPTGALKAAAIVPISMAYIYFIWTRTDGGFRWRWGPGKN
ncbi:hypothetical protein [Sphingomonas koreensis]